MNENKQVKLFFGVNFGLTLVLIVNGIVYLPFLFTKEYKEEK